MKKPTTRSPCTVSKPTACLQRADRAPNSRLRSAAAVPLLCAMILNHYEERRNIIYKR